MSASIRRRLLGAALLLAVAGVAGCGGGGGSSSGGGAATFSKSFGGAGNDEARAAIQTRNGGYLFVGGFNQTEGGLGSGELWITQLDANGDVQWQRTIADRSGSDSDRDRRFNVVRATTDGGYIVAGQASDRSGSGGTGADVWVAKFSAQGVAEWTHDHDSGAWRGFAYASARFGRGEFADDEATDVWPTADGGYVVAGRSVANLLTGAGSAHIGAQSVIAFRLNAAGDVVWRQRLTEGQFTADRFDEPFAPIARATSDGDALIGYDGTFEDGPAACVTRLSARDLPLWRVCERASESRGSVRIADLVQTDDPITSGAPSDGIRDNGFAVLVRQLNGPGAGFTSTVWKLAADGSTEWRTPGPLVDLRTVNQPCRVRAGGSGFDCEIVAGGLSTTDGGRQAGGGYLVRLDPRGGVIAERRFDDGSFGEVVTDIQVFENSQRLAVITQEGTSAKRLLVDRIGLGVLASSDALAIPGRQSRLHGPAVQLATDRRVLVADTAGQSFDVLASATAAAGQLALQRTVSISTRFRGAAGLAVVEVSPGSYVVAGTTASQPWMLRITQGQVEWQRTFESANFVDDRGRTAMTPSGDGGVVVANGRRDLVKFSGDGRIEWRSPFLGSDSELVFLKDVKLLADGGYVAVGTATRIGANGALSMLFRLDSSGTLLWQREYELLRAESIAPIDDGGFIVTGLALQGEAVGDLVAALRLDAEGAVLWSRSYRVAGAQAGVSIVASTPNRGFVLGFTDEAIISPQALGQPFGQSNVTLLLLDGDGNVVRSRTFGALLDETLHDLRVLADGGLLLAGASHSLGERSEAWLLRLGADATLAAGCNADLGSVTAAFVTREFTQRHALSMRPQAPAETSPLATTDTMQTAATPQTTVARQCFGTAGPPSAPGAAVTLTVTQPGTLTGVVTSTPAGIVCGTAAGDAGCSAMFAGGGDVVLAVDPGSVRDFLRWEDCDAVLPSESGAARCRVRVDRSRSVRAVFGQANDRFRLRFTINGRGTVTSGDNGIRCGQFFGTDQHCEAFYDAFLPGSTLRNSISLSVFTNAADFQGWGGDCASAGSAAAFNLTMDGDKTCTATFAGPPSGFDLTVQKSGVGSGTVVSAPPGISCGAACTAPYGIGVTVRLIASEDSGSAFDGWTGCSRLMPSPTGVIPICEVDMGSNRTVGAAFTRMVGNNPLLEFSVIGSDGIVESSDGGISCTSSGPDCQQLYTLGSSVGIGFNLLRSGATFQGWGGDCAFAGSALRFNVVMNTSKRCTATFSNGPAPNPPPQVTLTVQKLGFAALVVSTPAGIDCGPTCSASFASGSVARLAVTPGAGFTLSGWTGCDRQVPGAGGRADCEVDMTANKTVQVRVE